MSLEIFFGLGKIFGRKKKVDRKKNLVENFFESEKILVEFFFDRPKKIGRNFFGLEKNCKVIIVRVAVPPSEATIVRVVRVVRV